MRYGFQMQMMGATLCGQDLLQDGVHMMEELILANSQAEEDEIAEEVEILLGLREISVVPVLEYYMLAEMQLCDIPAELDGWQFPYGPPRKRSIASLSDYEALTFCNFRKGELRRILNCFDFPGEIRVECHHNNYYIFRDEEMLIFGLIKLATNMDDSKLCHLFFGGAPHRWSSTL